MAVVVGDVLSEPGIVNEASLVQRLALEPSGDGFVGYPPRGFQGRLYGGHLLAQSILAAGGSATDDDIVNSIHAYFLRAGDQTSPIHYNVDKLRSGRSFSFHSVRAIQNDRLIFHMTASFLKQRRVEGVRSIQMPDVPAPEELRAQHERPGDELADIGFRWRARERWQTASRPLDVRLVDEYQLPQGVERCLWFRAEPAPGAGQNTERSLLAFASDRTLLSTVSKSRLQDAQDPPSKTASVDHGMWFHDDVQAGRWHLYIQDSTFSTQGIGLARGHIFDRDGSLKADVIQQGVFSAHSRPEGQEPTNR